MAITITKQPDDKSVITLQGDLTIGSANELKDAFARTIAESNEVSVQLAEVSEVDLTCLQLLCSGHRSATRAKKQFLLAGNDRPDVFQTLVEAAGFARSMGCSLDCGKTCLWMPKARG